MRHWAASYDIKDAGNSIEMTGNCIGNGGDSIRIGLRCSGMARQGVVGIRVGRTISETDVMPFYVGELVRFLWRNNNICNS